MTSSVARHDPRHPRQSMPSFWEAEPGRTRPDLAGGSDERAEETKRDRWRTSCAENPIQERPLTDWSTIAVELLETNRESCRASAGTTVIEKGEGRPSVPVPRHRWPRRGARTLPQLAGIFICRRHGFPATAQGGFVDKASSMCWGTVSST